MLRRIALTAFVTLACGLLFAGGIFYMMGVLEKREAYDNHMSQAVVEPPEISGSVDVQLIQETDEELLRQIDFEVLQERNSDVAAWIYIPDTNVDPGFPVMQEPPDMEPGEYYYLWRDIDRVYDESSGGSIFMPYVPYVSDIPNQVQIMFGHRMKDRTLAFSNMKLFLDQDYLEEHRYVYVYYPDRAERYEAWAGCNADYMDVVYRIWPVYEKGSAEYGALVDHIRDDLAKSLSGRQVTSEDELLILSTCYQDDVRMFLACVRDRVYYYNGDFPSEDVSSDGLQ